jgi:hypothetical protein
MRLAVGQQRAEAWARVHGIGSGHRSIIEALHDDMPPVGVPLDGFDLPVEDQRP